MAEAQEHKPTNGVNPEPLKNVEPNDAPLVSTSTGKPSEPKVTFAPSVSSTVGNDQASAATVKPSTDQKKTSTTNDDGADTAEVEDDDGMDETVQAEMGVGKKKRKSKKKPKSKRGLNAPTGFEEYYVDAPVTPAEFEEEKQIYDSSYTFAQRIETAIQRFTAKRRLEPATKTLFDRYLIHGAVEAGPKTFGGIDAETLKTKTAAEIADLKATHYVDSDKIDAFDATHVVDFEGCLKSYLSNQLPIRSEFTSEEHVKKLVGIIRNFLNYLLHHDVCPEYEDQINAARSLCDKAAKELWNIKVMAALLPGDFNMACSEIFGGTYQGLYSADTGWMEESDPVSAGISPERARQAFKIGIAANASDEMFPKYREQLSKKQCRLVNSEDASFEITEIIKANETVLALYGQQQSTGLKTLGKINARTWLSPNAPGEDLTEEEEASLKASPLKGRTYEFWLEEDILERCKVGMKFEATVRETSFGLTYFDAISGVFCSFYQVISNALMEDWREIEKEWLPLKRNKYIAAQKKAGQQENAVEDGTKSEAGANPAESLENTEEPNQSHGVSTEDEQIGDGPENPEYNPNLVAAGYDDDFMETPLQNGDKFQPVDIEIGFGVEVHKVGEELKKVSGNTDTILQKNFDVKPTEELD